MSVHFSSATDLWATPQAFFDQLNKEFNFDLDVCANDENAKCDRYFTIADDGLSQDWKGSCWMNPPYGREIGRWMEKAYESAKGGGNRCLPCTGAHRHEMVARLCHKRANTVHSWPSEVWRIKKQRPISKRNRNF